MGKRKRKRPLVRARCKWDLNIKTDVYGNILDGLDCTDMDK